ncbi:MAG: hypothetical protein DHS20C02_20550 [Micavibrio sp.]|nr:MAG: hypothetical protein DHS20C02_20550 [Micavibrio sp.]
MFKKKEKKKKSDPAKKGSTIEALKEARALEKKKIRKWAIIVGTAIFLSVGVGYLMIPFKGGISYGVCKVFLETYVRYPHSLRVSTVEDFGDNIRIWFTQTDSFGEYRLEPIQCYYRPPTEEDKLKYGNVGFILERVTLRRRELDQATVDAFNVSIPGIVAAPPDLTLPTPIPDSLRDIQLDFERFRRPIFE